VNWSNISDREKLEIEPAAAITARGQEEHMGGNIDRFGIIHNQPQEAAQANKEYVRQNNWANYRPQRRRWRDIPIRIRSLFYAIMTTGVFYLLAPTCRPCRLALEIVIGQFGPIAGPLLLAFLFWMAIFGALTDQF
jgi:hypothetical protein